MSLIQLINIRKNYGGKSVLDDIDFQVNQGEKIGIIGMNGTGKTTLLKIILGEVEPDNGRVVISSGATMAYVSQVPEFSSDETILDLAFRMHNDLAPLRETMADCEQKMADGDDSVYERYSQAIDKFESMGGYVFESCVQKTLQQMGFDHLDVNRNLSELSAGEQKIAQLAAALSSKPTILLLDEPTNHTDTPTSEIIDEVIKKHKGTILYITHDRYLLNKVRGRVVEVRDSGLICFKGSYDDYVDFRFTSYESAVRKYKDEQRRKSKLRESMLKLKSKGQSGYDKAAKTAKAMERRLDAMDLERPSRVDNNVNISINMADQGGDIVLRAKELCKSYGEEEVLFDVNLEIQRGQKIGVVGLSGSGKTTLLNSLLGYTGTDHGEVWRGPSIRVGYLSQHDVNLNPDHSIYRELKESGCADQRTAHSFLTRLHFRDHDLDQLIGSLSGGERKKIQLIKIILEKPNLLVLDEPTDHLDMASREELERAVTEFSGTLIAVSQDRYFLDAVTDSTILLGRKSLEMLSGSYSMNVKRIYKAFSKQ